jgi:putative ABC transport system permease protein
VPEPPFDFGDNPEVLRGSHYFDVVGRLKEGATVAQAREQAGALSATLATLHASTNADRRAGVVPLLDAEVGDIQSTLWLLMGAVGLVLVIGCTNVAGLLLVRALEREREVLVRAAVGASGGRLVRQFLVESLLVGLPGGVLGVILAAWSLELIVALVPGDVPRLQEVELSLPVLGFALAAALLASGLAGAAPALFALGRRRSGSPLATGSRASAHRTRRVLVVVEVAISAMLLVGAGLMLRTLTHLSAVDPGFRADSTVAARVSLPQPKYTEDRQLRDFARAVLDRVRATPGVVSAGAVMSLPLDASGSAELKVHIAGRPPSDRPPTAGFQPATAGYFETMGIPLVSGRLFTEDDREGRPTVAVVSEAFARRFFPGADPVGQRLAWSDPDEPDVQWHTIVGVVGSTRHGGIREAPRAEAYVPFAQFPIPYLWFVAHGDSGTEATTRALRMAVTAADAGRPLSAVRTLTEVTDRSLALPRFGAVVLSTFAAVALVMAALGLYAVLAYGVSRRSREIGIRLALGAGRPRVIGDILGEGCRIVGIGLALGLLGALALSRLIASQLHGVQATDAVSFAGCAAILGAVSMLASLLPALRASRVSPAESLRLD